MSGASGAPHAAIARATRARSPAPGVWLGNVNQPDLGQRDRDGPGAALADQGLPQGSGERGPPSARRAGAEKATPGGVWLGLETPQRAQPSDLRDDAV